MKTLISMVMLLTVAFLLTGCAGAAFNKIELTMSRNITIGQELIDLHEAHEKGIISDTEYIEAKNDILSIVSQIAELKGPEED